MPSSRQTKTSTHFIPPQETELAGEASNKETETAAAAAAALAAQRAQNAHQDRPAPSTSLSHSIDKLDETMATGHSNYNAWRFRLTRILKEKGLLTIVTEGPGSTPNNGESASSVVEKSPERESANLCKDNQAFTIITLNVRDSQIPHIQKCSTAKQAWAFFVTYIKGSVQTGE